MGRDGRLSPVEAEKAAVTVAEKVPGDWGLPAGWISVDCLEFLVGLSVYRKAEG